MRKYLVLGNKGQLGKEFCKIFEDDNVEYRGYDIDELDISDAQEVNTLVSSYKPSFIINCAAYNLVDKAEENYNDAFISNALGVKNIAIAAKTHGAFVVHYGTDYVFDGTKGLPYTEEDAPNPINNYARTKLEGEKLLAENTDNYLLFRVSWVFGVGQQNFIHKLKSWSENKDTLQIASDEISVPTSTKTITDITLKSIEHGLWGLYHLTNSGYASRFEWAEEILKNLDIKKNLEPVSKDIFKLPAPRPAFTALDNKKISQELNISIPTWQDALRDFLSISFKNSH